MIIAAAYIRVSTDDQLEYSPDSQIKLIREYAKKNEMIVPDEFIFKDEGISGRRADKRPAFMQMIATAKQKPRPFDVILVYSLSRFARNREDSVVFKRMLRKDLGVELISISQDLGNDKSSILIEAMLEAMDEYYSIDLGENVKRGMLEKVSRGEPVATAPFGYYYDNKRLIKDHDKAIVVQRIFTDFISGKGYRQIACELNALGIRTNRGNLFENRTIEYILQNPCYIGKIRWNPARRTRRNYDDPNLMIVDGQHDPIIDVETWEETQRQIAEIKRIYRQREPKRRLAEFALKGLVVCSNCGATLHRAGEHYLQCTKYAHGRCTVSHGVQIEPLTEAVFAKIINDFENQSFNIEAAPPPVSSDNELLQAQIKKEQQKLLRVKEAFQAGVDSLDEYRENKKRIEAAILALAEQIKPEPRPAAAADFKRRYSATLRDLLSSASPALQNSLLREFVKKIVYNKKDNSFQIYYHF